jgi:hypothetical protein
MSTVNLNDVPRAYHSLDGDGERDLEVGERCRGKVLYPLLDLRKHEDQNASCSTLCLRGSVIILMILIAAMAP